MNWRRGFFRIWLIAAALWLLFGVSYQGSNLLVSRPESLMEFYERHGFQFIEAPPRERIPRSELKGFISYLEDMQGYRENPDYKKWEEKLTAMKSGSDFQVPEWNYRIAAASFIFGPPLAILLIGLGIAWAISGFRDKHG